MQTHIARRAVGDVYEVWRSASPAAAGRWMTSLTHLPECARTRSLNRADQAWARAGASFRTSSGAVVSLPPAYTAGAREMYCRNIYLRTGLTMPANGWVIDLGANRGLFATWAAMNGARVVAVEAQQGFEHDIRMLARHNAIADQVHIEIGLAGGANSSARTVGFMANDETWVNSSHTGPARPSSISVPELMSRYQISRVGLIKFDIEGGEFSVFAKDEDLSWTGQVDQIALEVHPDFGDAPALIERIRRCGFMVDLRDNDGASVVDSSASFEYAYCRR